MSTYRLTFYTANGEYQVSGPHHSTFEAAQQAAAANAAERRQKGLHAIEYVSVYERIDGPPRRVRILTLDGAEVSIEQWAPSPSARRRALYTGGRD